MNFIYLKRKKFFDYGIICSILVISIQAFYYCQWFQRSGIFTSILNTEAHVTNAALFCRNFATAHTFKELSMCLFPNVYWPPLHYFLTFVFAQIFGTSYTFVAMLNVFYLSVLFFSVSGIAHHMSKNKGIGVIAGIICASFPLIMNCMIAYELQMCLLAFTSLSIYCLIRSNNFISLPFSILFAISFCLAMYSDRFIALIYILGPLVAVLYNASHAIKQRKVVSRKIYVHLVIVFLLIGILLWPFYLFWVVESLSNLQGILSANKCITGNMLYGKYALFFSRLLFYPVEMVRCSLGIMWSIMFLIGCCVYQKIKCKYKSILVWWLLLPFIVFTCIPKKDTFYFIGCLPAVAIMCAFVCFVGRKMLRMLCIAGIIACSLFYFKFCIIDSTKGLEQWHRVLYNFNYDENDPIFCRHPMSFLSKNYTNPSVKKVVNSLPNDTAVSKNILAIGYSNYIFDYLFQLSFYNPFFIIHTTLNSHEYMYINPCQSDYVLLFTNDIQPVKELDYYIQLFILKRMCRKTVSGMIYDL